MKNRHKSFIARFTPKEKALLKKLAASEDRSMNDMLCIAMNYYAETKKISVEWTGGKYE